MTPSTLAGEVRWFLDAWKMPVKMVVDMASDGVASGVTDRGSFAVVPLSKLYHTLSDCCCHGLGGRFI